MNLFTLNQNPVFLGICMIIMNIGSKFISADLSEYQTRICNTKIMKFFILFCMLFLTTRDVKTSFFIAIGFFVLLSGILNENSQINIIIPIQRMFEFIIRKSIEQEDSRSN